MATLNYAEEYSRALSQAYPSVLQFGDLYNTPNNGVWQWVDGRTINIATITTSGRTDADRDTIATAKRNYDNKWTPYTLTNQRMWGTLVHPKDIDQTNMTTTIGNITQVYNETQKFPEMDKYCVSKIYADWVKAGKTADTTELTASNILSTIDSIAEKMDDAKVPMDMRILYVTPAVNTIIKNANSIDRQINIDKTGATTINRQVSRLDEFTIKRITSDVMQTLFDFTTGAVKADEAQAIRMFAIDPRAVITPVSYDTAGLDEPSAISGMKYVYYEESHEDVFILPERVDAIWFNVVAKPVTP